MLLSVLFFKNWIEMILFLTKPCWMLTLAWYFNTWVIMFVSCCFYSIWFYLWIFFFLLALFFLNFFLWFLTRLEKSKKRTSNITILGDFLCFIYQSNVRPYDMPILRILNILDICKKRINVTDGSDFVWVFFVLH